MECITTSHKRCKYRYHCNVHICLSENVHMPLSMQYRYATKEIQGYVSYFRIFSSKVYYHLHCKRLDVLAVLAMGMEELGPVQLILMLGDAVRPKIDWLARIGLLHDTHTCMQCHVTSGGTAGRPGRVSVLVSAVQRTNKYTEAGLNRGSLFGFCSRGRRTCHRTTWRDTWVSRIGRWSTGRTSSKTSAQRTRSDSRCSSVWSTTPGVRSSSSSTSPNFIVGNTTAAES